MHIGGWRTRRKTAAVLEEPSSIGSADSQEQDAATPVNALSAQREESHLGSRKPLVKRWSVWVLVLVAAATVTFFAAGGELGSGDSRDNSNLTPDEAFEFAWEVTAPSRLKGLMDDPAQRAKVMELGHQTCQFLRAGFTKDELTREILGDIDQDIMLFNAVWVSGVVAYCPEYVGE